MDFLFALKNFVKELAGVFPAQPKPFALYQRLLARSGDLKASSDQAEKFKQGFLEFLETYPDFHTPGGLFEIGRNYAICYGDRADISIPIQKVIEVNMSDPDTVKAISNHLVFIASIIKPGSVPEERVAMLSKPTSGVPDMPPGMVSIFNAIGEKMKAMGAPVEGEREVKRFQKVLAEVVEMDEFADMLEIFIGTMQDGGEEAEAAMAQNPMFSMFASMAPQMFGGAPPAVQPPQ